MAQIRGCLMKIFSSSRQLTYLQSKYLKVKGLSQLIGSELLGQERVGSAFLQQRHFQYQRYCSEASKLEKRQDEDIQIPEDHTAIGDVSKKDIMKSNSISFLLEIIKSETRSTHSEKIGLKNSQACFHRLAWLVTENMELKEEKAKELFCDPEFQEISNFIESRVETLNPDYLCSVLGSLLQMTVEDTWLIKRIEMALLQKVEHALTVKQAKGLVEIHADHQETELRQAVSQAAVKVLDDPFNRQLNEMVDWGADASTEEIQELLQEALKNANKLDSVQIYKLFVLMSVKNIRSGPLIDTMISNLGESTLMYTRKELKDIFYAVSMLSIQDQTVLEKLTKNVLAVSHRKDRKKLYPILVSCSRLGWKPESLSAIFRNEILYLLSSTAIEPTTLASLVQSLGHLYWTGFGGPEFFELAIKCLENLKDKNPKLWLEAVWSLAIMRRTTEEMIQDVLTDSNCEQIEQSIADKPNHVKVGVMKKLLNLTGHSILECKGANVPSGDSKAKTKPVGYDVWMKTLKEDLKNQGRRSSLRKSVEQTLKSLNPVSLTTTKLLDYGHIIDIELQVTMPGETEGAAKKLERVGVKLLDFKAMYRTEGAPQITGENRMCIRHLRLMDYPFFTVQYNEWLLQDSEDQKRKYLSDRLSTAIQRTRHVQTQNQNKKE